MRTDILSSNILQQSDDYYLHVLVTKPVAPQGVIHVLIQSQWLGAKDPTGLQTVFSKTLTTENALALAKAIQGAALVVDEVSTNSL